ncbi:hypothetical protein BU15DRAFT_81703 [Melanogaster broomeanus]|nr:hypothetical protein BU15DRAFT_81703 [Melanogaster broomeanus]
MHETLPVHSSQAITEIMSTVYASSDMLSALYYRCINFSPTAEDEVNPTLSSRMQKVREYPTARGRQDFEESPGGPGHRHLLTSVVGPRTCLAKVLRKISLKGLPCPLSQCIRRRPLARFPASASFSRVNPAYDENARRMFGVEAKPARCRGSATGDKSYDAISAAYRHQDDFGNNLNVVCRVDEENGWGGKAYPTKLRRVLWTYCVRPWVS